MAAIADELKRIPMSPVLGDTLARAADYAQAQNHGAVELEHLLLALTEDEDATQVLAASHVDLSLLKADVSQYLGGLGDHGGGAPGNQFMVAPDLKRILEAAAAAASQGKRREINGAIVLAAIVGDGRSSAAHMLRAQGLTFEEAIKALQRALAQAPPPAPAPVAALDAEDVLASARARVQSRAAPSVTLPARPEPPPEPVPQVQTQAPVPPQTPPKAAAWPPEVRSSQPSPAPEFDAARPAEPPVQHGVEAHPRGRRSPEFDPPFVEPVEADAEPVESGGDYGGGERYEAAPYPEPPPMMPQVQPQQHAPQPPPQAAYPQPAYPQAPPAPPVARARPPQPLPGSRWPAPVAPAWRETEVPPAPEPEWRHPPAPPLQPASMQPPSLQPPPLPASGPPGLPAGTGYGEPPSLGAPWPPAVPPAPAPYSYQPESYQADALPPPVPDAGAPWPEPDYQPHWPHQEGPHQGGLHRPADDPRYGSAPIGPPPSAAERAPMPTLHADGPGLGEATRTPRRRKPAERVTAGQMVETIPRQMRAHVPSPVEVRLAKAEFQTLADGLQAEDVRRHAVVVAPAMSVKLRAPDGGFIIDSASPETQWLETRLGLIESDFASWRWTVTPLKAGRRRLQLVVSARTPGPDGAAADTALPDQIVDVRVGVNYGRAIGRAAGWMLVAVAGGLFAKFGGALYDPALAAVLAALK
jgi:neural Wiskott-Aldrich syndrome protein